MSIKAKLISGKRFGRLLVVSEYRTEGVKKEYFCNCVCDCGKSVVVRKYSLTGGDKNSCGCLKKDMNKRIKDYTGKKLGRLTFIEFVERKNKKTFWRCRCDCGNIVVLNLTYVRDGETRSCGCLQTEAARINGLKNICRGLQSMENLILHRYHVNSRKNKTQFSLSKEEFIEIIHKKCFYCGKMDFKRLPSNNELYLLNGVDRLDNNLGYTKENSVSCCSKCNYAKRLMDVDEFFEWVENVYKFQMERQV